MTSNRPQKTSRRPQTNQLDKKKQNKLKSGANIEINEKHLDEIIHNNYLQMDIAIQVISNAKRVRSDTLHDLKEFNNQSLATEAKKGEQLVSMTPATRKSF